MMTIDGYKLSENLYKGTRTEVYRGTRISDGKPVIIKVLGNRNPNFNQLVQFRNQYVITRNLEHRAIVQPLALERYGNGYALVMPSDGAIALSDYWPHSDRSLTEFLAIAMQLADALHYLNRERIIHKDIKPANILIHPETRFVQLIDFSISSLLPSEQQQLLNPNVLEGTLAYISPEQTGRMNRGIDYRTDFYSLGVTFFELLTGKLPFASRDPMELVHCHIAQGVQFPVDSQVPKVVQEIVLKLMAKNAEYRYQSALGLQHDLSICLQQLSATGEIAAFELGQQDRSDRFIIPEKLYGREAEVQSLLDGFDRVSAGGTLMMLVAGFSGIGKTAVINEVHKPIVRQRGYFIKGKFDQFNRNIPFSAFVQSFRDLMGQLLGESDASLLEWKAKIIEAVGENGQVIIDVIPELEQIIGKQPAVPELSGSAAQNRFNLLFSNLVRVFTTKEHPLVIFIDDLQWADSASLNLFKLLMNSEESGYLLVLGAYRDNEVFPAHPLMLSLDDLVKQGAKISTVTLAPLSEVDINRLVADTVLCSTEIAAPLSELVYQKTQGNPFFTTQFLQGLHADGCITFDADALYWQCDLAQLRSLALTDDVVEFMVGRLQKLPPETQSVLKLASCIGNQFDLATLAVVCSQTQEEVATSLWQALSECFVIPESQTYKFFQKLEATALEDVAVGYRFLHDRVQQAAYSLIPDDQKEITHYHIGQLLLQKIPPAVRQERIFELVSQLNYGTTLITEQNERDELAKLNLLACRKARASTAYQAGREYANMGLALLGKKAWQRQYEMSLAFHDESAELASLCGDALAMEQFVETVRLQTGSLLEQVNAYRIIIQSKISQDRLTEAIAIGLEFLQKLNITFPETPTENDIQQAIAGIVKLIGDRDLEELVYLPMMTDGEKIAIIEINNSIMPAASISGSPVFPLLVALSVKLSVEYGNTSASAYAYACYGLIACNLLPEENTGVKFGHLALRVISQQDDKTVKSKVLFIVGLFIFHHQSHVKETLPLLQESYTSGLEAGNLEFAGYSAHGFCSYSFWCGHALAILERETKSYYNGLVQLNQLTTANWCGIYWQSMLNLLGVAEEPSILSGGAMEEAEILPLMLEAMDFFGLYLFYLYKLMLCYLFGEVESAQNQAVEVGHYLVAAAGTVGEPVFYFYDSLTALAALNGGSAPLDGEATSEAFGRVEQNQTRLRKHWAHYAPMNHQHKVDLVAAEKCRIKGQKVEAIELYDRAIAGAKENDYLQEEALANELAAKFYLDWGFGSAQPNGKEKVASGYMQEAYYCYARWGAKAKTDQLEAKYPQLLAGILQQPPWQWMSGLTATSTVTQTAGSTSSTTDFMLDWATAMKAAQSLSREIHLDKLVSALMKAVMENAGADGAILLLQQPEGWQVAVQYSGEDGDLRSTEVPDEGKIPTLVINKVKRSSEAIIVNDFPRDTQFAADPYLLQGEPKSFLCTPILNQGKLIGILYLENHLATGAFTGDRVELLNLLCSQAAISLENARLYQQAQQALTDLQKAQLQLVQSEKMSALGNLVAGVAHEINNPVGFIAGNLDPARDYVSDLFGLIDLYQQKYPNPDAEIEEEIEAIDLEFLRSDLPQLISSMREGTDRIRHISTSLRTFSRTDKEHKIPFDIHQGIESTLLILKHRLKANEERPAIEIVKDYGGLPEVQCFPGQLNQVFMNLIANAIDALESANSGRSFDDITANPNRIALSTSGTAAEVTISIADNGTGMPEEVKQRIFEQGFTTKAVGKGTGLGMAIARQIVEEKHGGTITCDSTPGLGTTFTIALPIA